MFSPAEELARDLDAIKPLNGLHVGMLEEKEIDAFNRLCERGLARRKYEGAAQLLGLAKVDVDLDA